MANLVNYETSTQERQANELRILASEIARIIGINTDTLETAAVTDARIRVTADGNVQASASIKVSKYFSVSRVQDDEVEVCR